MSNKKKKQKIRSYLLSQKQELIDNKIKNYKI